MYKSIKCMQKKTEKAQKYPVEANFHPNMRQELQ